MTVERPPTEPKSELATVTEFNVLTVVQEHDSVLEQHQLLLSVQAEQIKQLQDSSVKLENIVMSENRETRLVVTETNKQLMEVITGLMGFKSGQGQITQAITIARWESIAKIIGILAGSGGILYWLFGQNP